MSDGHGDSSDKSRPRSEQLRHEQVSALVPAHVAAGVFCTGAVVLEGSTEFVIDFLLRLNKPQRVAARVVLSPAVVGRFASALAENVRLYEQQFGDQRLRPLQPIGAADDAANQRSTDDVEDAEQAADRDEFGADSGTKPDAESSSDLPGGLDAPLLAGAGVPAPMEHDQTTGDGTTKTSVSELYEQLKLPDEQLSGSYANAVMVGHTASEFSFDFITTFFPRSAVSQRVFMAAGNVRPFLDSLTHAFSQFQQKHTRPPGGE